MFLVFVYFEKNCFYFLHNKYCHLFVGLNFCSDAIPHFNVFLFTSLIVPCPVTLIMHDLF